MHSTPERRRPGLRGLLLSHPNVLFCVVIRGVRVVSGCKTLREALTDGVKSLSSSHHLEMTSYQQKKKKKKLNLSWSNHVEYGAGLNWSTSLFHHGCIIHNAVLFQHGCIIHNAVKDMGRHSE